jgi:hypothetical protein
MANGLQNVRNVLSINGSAQDLKKQIFERLERDPKIFIPEHLQETPRTYQPKKYRFTTCNRQI